MSQPFTDRVRKVWTAPVLEQLTVDLDAIASKSNGGGDSKKTTHQPS